MVDVLLKKHFLATYNNKNNATTATTNNSRYTNLKLKKAFKIETLFT
jgi:hypothetical protein